MNYFIYGIPAKATRATRNRVMDLIDAARKEGRIGDMSAIAYTLLTMIDWTADEDEAYLIDEMLGETNDDDA